MRKNLYPVLIAVTGLLFLTIVLFAKKPHEGPPAFKERTGALAQSPEWLNTRQQMQGWLSSIEANPKDFKSKLLLAQAYIQEARITGNHAYYDKAALDLLDDIISSEPKNFDALCCKATVLLSQHHFSDGLEIAKQAASLNTYSAFVYGLMCDSYVELGNYDEAVKMADKMVSLRPDLRSYSRVSYLREIYGDIPGAISAIKLAVAAGYPGTEETEWTRMILGHLYENSGQPDSAAIQYTIALNERPDYAFAYAGLGRIEAARGHYAKAITLLEKAKSLITEFSFSDELTDLYALNGNPAGSKKSAEEVIAMLSPNANADESASGHGHYADKELAYAYLKAGDNENALKHAMIEYDRRPENIDINEAVAWVHYRRGEFAEANKYIDKALRTGSKNPVLLCRAGLIKIKAGQNEKGAALINESVRVNPYLDPMLKKEAAPYLILE